MSEGHEMIEGGGEAPPLAQLIITLGHDGNVKLAIPQDFTVAQYMLDEASGYIRRETFKRVLEAHKLVRAAPAAALNGVAVNGVRLK